MNNQLKIQQIIRNEKSKIYENRNQHKLELAKKLAFKYNELNWSIKNGKSPLDIVSSVFVNEIWKN
jgi:hypothetical protein